MKVTFVGIVTAAVVATAMLAPVASAATTTVCRSSCTYATLQSAINNAKSGDTIQVGTVDLTLSASQVLSITKPLTLRSTSITSIKKSVGTVEQPMISVNLSSPGTVKISGFSFMNSGTATGSANSANSASVAIVIAGDGSSVSNRSEIRGNTFTGISDTAIVFSSAGSHRHWSVVDNKFNNVLYGMFFNGAGSVDLLVAGNLFTSYLAGMNNYDDKNAITDLRVVGNTFQGTCAAVAGTCDSGSRAINLHANASSDDADLNWMIANNRFQNHSGMAIRIRDKQTEAAGRSMSGVFIASNFFAGNAVDVVDQSTKYPKFALNYWDGCDPLSAKFTDGSDPLASLLSAASGPWIAGAVTEAGAALRPYKYGFYPVGGSVGPTLSDGC